jgi:hypothetical protein
LGVSPDLFLHAVMLSAARPKQAKFFSFILYLIFF